MPRLLFEKIGNAVWISHLDLMRLFQRAFKRAGLPLKHSQGFSPRPYVSVILPLSVGVESVCEMLDFDLEGESVPKEEIKERLNRALTDGVRVLDVYEDGAKIKHLALLDCSVTMEYDQGVPADAADMITDLFRRDSLLVEKKSKNGPTQQDIIPMIRRIGVTAGEKEIVLRALVCCQNPALNPMQLVSAVRTFLPDMAPDHAWSRRNEIYHQNENVFR